MENSTRYKIVSIIIYHHHFPLLFFLNAGSDFCFDVNIGTVNSTLMLTDAASTSQGIAAEYFNSQGFQELNETVGC